jgi:hypothetical protein
MTTKKQQPTAIPVTTVPGATATEYFTLTRSKEGHALWSITDEHGEPIDGLGGQYTGLYAAKDAIDQYEEKKVSLSAHRPKGSVAEQPNKEAPNE